VVQHLVAGHELRARGQNVAHAGTCSRCSRA
jgi:hypothetical protein